MLGGPVEDELRPKRGGFFTSRGTGQNRRTKHSAEKNGGPLDQSGVGNVTKGGV